MGWNHDLDSVVRKIPDFPKPGVLFYDITGILAVPEAFSYCIEKMAVLCEGRAIDSVAGVEARGFLFAAPLARYLHLPLILVRKRGKLPGKTFEREFSLEYGSDAVCVQQTDVRKDERVLLVDDLIATGGTLYAAASIFTDHGAIVEGILGVIGLPFLRYTETLCDYRTDVLLTYGEE